MRVFSILLLSIISCNANAQYSVPTECISIANKEGYNLILNTKKEIIKAKTRLVYLRATHPKDKEIRQCDKVVNELILLLNK